MSLLEHLNKRKMNGMPAQQATEEAKPSLKPGLKPTLGTGLKAGLKPKLGTNSKPSLSTQARPQKGPVAAPSPATEVEHAQAPSAAGPSSTLDVSDVNKIENHLNMLAEALEASFMGEVKEHMHILQKELQGTEYLVDMLRPEDIGLLVKAERKLRQDDILAATKPKTRKTSTRKSNVSQAELDAVSSDDFAL